MVPGPRTAPEPVPTHADAPTLASAADPTSTSELTPVFVDTTGQRRRLIRRAAIALLAVACAYGIAVVLSFLGGPVPPNALLPIPDAPNAASSNPASPANSNATPRVNSSTAQAGSGGGTGAVPAPDSSNAASPSRPPSPSASPSPTGNRHVPPGHVGKSASPGPSNGHGR